MRTLGHLQVAQATIAEVNALPPLFGDRDHHYFSVFCHIKESKPHALTAYLVESLLLPSGHYLVGSPKLSATRKVF